MNMVGPLPKIEEGYEYKVTIMDFCSRFAPGNPNHTAYSLTIIEVETAVRWCAYVVGSLGKGFPLVKFRLGCKWNNNEFNGF